MKALHQLIHSLSSSEKRIVRTALTSFSSRKDANTKSLKLFDYIANNKSRVPTNTECSECIYGKKDKRFKMLKLRFREKLLDSMVSEISLGKREVFEADSVENIIAKKRILQFLHLYNSKGNQIILDNLLNQVIHISKKFELYASLVEALRLKKYKKGFVKGEKDFNEINKQITFYEFCSNSVFKAGDHYYRLIMRTDFYANVDKNKMQKYLNESIKELKKDYEYTKSALVGYYLKCLEIAYYENLENYFKALEACGELLSIIRNNKSVYRKSRLAYVYFTLCKYNIFIGQYAMAISNAKLSESTLAPSSVNYLALKEYEYAAWLYENQMEKADTVIHLMMEKASKLQGHDFRLSKYRFYYTNVLFKKGDYKTTLKELNMPFEISKDKEGYDTAIRLLTIMTLIELGRYDEASTRMDNLRKHIERNIQEKTLRKRDKLILKLLQLLDKFVYEPTAIDTPRVRGYIELLAGDKKEYKWQPLSSELIPFHEWFAGRFLRERVIGEG